MSSLQYYFVHNSRDVKQKKRWYDPLMESSALSVLTSFGIVRGGHGMQ